MELTDSLKTLRIETAKSLKGSARRLFMARPVKELGRGGPQRAARELPWGRLTIRKGMRELDSGMVCLDAFALRGRQRAEVHLPNLLRDIQAIGESQSQGRSPLPLQPSLYAPDSGRGAAPVDRPKRLRGYRTANGRNHRYQSA